MKPFILKAIVLFTCSILYCQSYVHAQTNVWSKPKDNSNKALKKVDKGKKKIRIWKKHVEEFGLSEDWQHQISVGGSLNSNGWSGSIYYFRNDDNNSKHIYRLSFSEIKHEKQIKQVPQNPYPELGAPTPYIYGKINNLYQLQLVYGKDFTILPDVVDGNLSVGYRIMGGFSLAMLKPYYLKQIYVDQTVADPIPELKEEQYSDANAEAFLRTGNKLGAAAWSNGLKEIKYTPGVFIESAIVLEPQVTSWFVQTITIGGQLAYHTKPLPIMAEVKNYRLQACLFIGLSIGKRW